MFYKCLFFLLVAKYQNKEETEKIGKQISKLRKSKSLSQDEVAFMSGFAKSTIANIEKGSNTDISHIIEIAKAIGIQPREIFDIEFQLSPRYKLSPDKANKLRLTEKISNLITDNVFFKTPKFVKDVILELKNDTDIKIDSTHVSVTLIRFSSEGKLKYGKVGRNNFYSENL